MLHSEASWLTGCWEVVSPLTTDLSVASLSDRQQLQKHREEKIENRPIQETAREEGREEGVNYSNNILKKSELVMLESKTVKKIKSDCKKQQQYQIGGAKSPKHRLSL